MHYPHVSGANVTHRRAVRATATPGVQASLLFGSGEPTEADEVEEPEGT